MGISLQINCKDRKCKMKMRLVLPDGPTALGHPANEDLFAGTPVRATTSWWVCRSGWGNGMGPSVARRERNDSGYR